MPTALLEFQKISKAYGNLRANDQISFSVQAGHIHALIGENGAGKSTLMKILFGLEQPTEGRILFNGKEISFRSPKEAKKQGFGMVHQHFQLASSLSALDHVILEQPTRSWFSFFEKLDRKDWLNRLEALSLKFKMPVPWAQKVETLPVGIQQRIEILRLLAFDAQVLVLDEPTAVLTPQEIEQFLNQLKDLRASGKTILLITHKLKEVLAVADTVTVLRQGKVVASGPVKGESEHSLASKMVGTEFQPREFQRSEIQEKIVLDVKALSGLREGRSVLEGVQFQIRRGEILGIAGVEGNGQSDLIQAIALPQESKVEWDGEVLLDGRNLLAHSNPEIRKMGVGLVPEDRLHQAVVPALSAQENYQLGRLDWIGSLRIQKQARDTELEQSIRKFSVRPANPKLTFANFSGGNQQKLVLARELGANPQIMVVAQPTRGVDIGAIEQIHEALVQARNQGMAILLISSELEELLRLSDRLIVLSRGKAVAEIARQDFDLTAIGCHMGGSTK